MKTHGWEGWFTPAALGASQAGRGRAALPNHELLSFESLSATPCLCGAFKASPLSWNFSSSRAC